MSLTIAALTLLAGCRLGSPAAPAGKAGPDAERRTARVGVIHLGHDDDAPVVVGLRAGLQELGYVEGRDIVLEIRAGRGRPELAREAVRELVRMHMDLLVSAGTVATQAAQELAGGRPIVFTQVGDPVGAGFVQSLARPGGTLTGFATLLPATTGKRLELLRELVPRVSTVLIIFDPSNPTSDAAAAEARRSAAQLRVRLLERHVKSPEEVAAALREVNREMTDALLMLPDSLVANAGDQIIELSRRERIPVMFHEAQWVERGGLASYGASFVELGRQAATYVDKILRGSNPAELPVQQPTRFDFVINLKAAQALGLMIPSTVLARATEVIQ